MVGSIFNMTVRKVRSWDVCVKRLADMPWSTCRRLVPKKDGKQHVFPTQTRGDYFWTFGWPVVGEDTLSPRAPILGRV